MPAAEREADTWRELLFDVVSVLPALTEPDRWPLDERLRAHDVLRRALEAEQDWHEARRHIALPDQRPPLAIDLVSLAEGAGVEPARAVDPASG